MSSITGETSSKPRKGKAKAPRQPRKRAWYSYTHAAERAAAEFEALQQQARGLVAENQELKCLDKVLTLMVAESNDTLHHVGVLAPGAQSGGGSVLDTLCLDARVQQALDSLQAPLQPTGSNSHQIYTSRCLQAAHGAAGVVTAQQPAELLQLVRQQVLQLASALSSDAGCNDAALQPLVDRYVQLHALALTAGCQPETADLLCSTNLATLQQQDAPPQHWRTAAQQLRQLLRLAQVAQLREAFRVYEGKRGMLQGELRRLALELDEDISCADAPAAAAEGAAAAAEAAPGSPRLALGATACWPGGCTPSAAASPATSAAANNAYATTAGGASSGSSGMFCAGAASGCSSPSIITMLDNSGSGCFLEFMVKPEAELLQELNQHLLAPEPASPLSSVGHDDASAFGQQQRHAQPAVDARARVAPVAAPAAAFSLARLWGASCKGQEEVWAASDRLGESVSRLQRQLKLCRQLDHRLELLWLNSLEPRQLAQCVRLSFPFVCSPVHLCQFL